MENIRKTVHRKNISMIRFFRNTHGNGVYCLKQLHARSIRILSRTQVHGNGNSYRAQFHEVWYRICVCGTLLFLS